MIGEDMDSVFPSKFINTQIQTLKSAEHPVQLYLLPPHLLLPAELPLLDKTRNHPMPFLPRLLALLCVQPVALQMEIIDRFAEFIGVLSSLYLTAEFSISIPVEHRTVNLRPSLVGSDSLR